MSFTWSTGMTTVTVLVALAAITPGPNNLIVLRAASRHGVRGALPAIAGVVLGGLVLLAIALSAANLLTPALLHVLHVAGCAYLVWLGVSAFRHAGVTSDTTLPARALGVLGFQLVNPKAWVMVLTATSTIAQPLILIAIFVAVPITCLLVWALAGAALSRWLARPRVAITVDRALGILLIVAGAALWR